MRAQHKYNKNNKEGARRIAQSFGFKHTIHMHPKMYALLKRGGIDLFPMGDMDDAMESQGAPVLSDDTKLEL